LALFASPTGRSTTTSGAHAARDSPRSLRWLACWPIEAPASGLRVGSKTAETAREAPPKSPSRVRGTPFPPAHGTASWQCRSAHAPQLSRVIYLWRHAANLPWLSTELGWAHPPLVDRRTEHCASDPATAARCGGSTPGCRAFCFLDWGGPAGSDVRANTTSLSRRPKTRQIWPATDRMRCAVTRTCGVEYHLKSRREECEALGNVGKIAGMRVGACFWWRSLKGV